MQVGTLMYNRNKM